MGKVKQTLRKVSKPAAKESKILQKNISKKKTIKHKDLVPVLKKIGVNVLLNDSEPEPTFHEDNDEKPFISLVARPKNDLFDENQIQSGVSALFELIEKTSAGKEPTLFEDGENIYLQIVCIKIPKTPSRQIHMNLPHSLLKSDSEICLIVQDREDAKDYDNTIEYYEKLLKKHGVTNVKDIVPYHQFNNEYAKQFELKRKFASLYDYFLVEGAVHGYVVSRLGKIFYAKRRMPVAINMKATNLKSHFEKVLCKSVLQVHSNSDCYSVEVGNTKMKPEEVAENVISVAEALNDSFPGGSANVRSLGVKTNSSMRIPLYLSLRGNKTVQVPVIKAKRPKGFKAVSGELTTFTDRKVTVLPSGEIIVRDKKNKKRPHKDLDDEELVFDEPQSESEDEEKPETLLKKMKQEKKKVKKEAKEDSNLDEAEESYLNFYKQEQVKMAKEQKESKKNKPQNKKIVEESEDDLNLEDSDGSDFDEAEHPNFDESEESDADQKEIANFHEKKAGKNKPANKKVKQESNNKKGNQIAKIDKTNGSAKFENRRKTHVKKENVELKQVIKENKMEVVPIQVKGGNRKRKQDVLEIKKETAVEKASTGEKNKKFNKKQREAVAPNEIENVAVPIQKKIEPVAKRDKKAVLTKQNDNVSLKQNKNKITLKEVVAEAPNKKAKKEMVVEAPTKKAKKEIAVEAPTKKAKKEIVVEAPTKRAKKEIVVVAPTKKTKKEIENKSPKQQKVVKKSKKPNPFAVKAK